MRRQAEGVDGFDGSMPLMEATGLIAVFYVHAARDRSRCSASRSIGGPSPALALGRPQSSRQWRRLSAPALFT